MIINSIHAENVLKYSVLELDNIPARGLISVTGDNESGKSSIGECICFALFGRTFSLEPDELDKVLRWGESRCSIRVDFTTPDGSRYQIARFLDKQGNHGASISLSGEDPLVRGVEEVAERLKAIIGFGYTEFVESFYLAQREISTPNPHSFAVKAMAGVDAMEQAIIACKAESEGFREQLAETEQEKVGIDAEIAELNLVQGHLEALEGRQQDLIGRIDDAHARIRSLTAQSLDAKQTGDRLVLGAKRWMAVKGGGSHGDYLLQAQVLGKLLSGIGPVYGEHPHTRDAIAAINDFAGDAQRPLDELDTLSEGAAVYRRDLQQLLGEPDDSAGDDGQTAGEGAVLASVQTLPERRQALRQEEAELRGNRRHWRLLLAICLPLALLAGGWLWALNQADPIGAPANAELLPMLLSWLPVVAGIAAVFAVSGGWYASRVSVRLSENLKQQQRLEAEERGARDHLQRLAELDSVPLSEAMALLSAARDRDLAGLADAFVSGSGAVLLDAGQFAARRRLLRDRVVGFTEGLIRMRDEAAASMKALDAQIAADGEQRDALKQDIDVERERVDKYLALKAVADNLQERIEDLGHRMQVRALSVDLLEGAIHYISQRFNTEVRNLSADSLLKFTNGRYEHLQIDQDLNVKAFSAEKRDFMQLDEISSGTQRQIMLAVRMSLSQKLVNSVIQGPQMLFLDEPFAFFDEDRTASSLAVLPEVSGDFTQIWVTSQKFPARSHFDIHIECNARESVSPWISYTGEASPQA